MRFFLFPKEKETMPGRLVPDFWWPAAGRRERKRERKERQSPGDFFAFEKREGEPEKKVETGEERKSKNLSI